MQGREMVPSCRQYATNTRQYRGQAYATVQRGDHLWQLCRRDPPPQNSTEDASNSRYGSKLDEDLSREADGRQRREYS